MLTSLNFVPRDGGIDVEDINRQIAVWKRLGMVDAKVTPEMVLDRALLTRRYRRHNFSTNRDASL